MGKVDLHIHTAASDGKYTPSQIVVKAKESGLAYIAISDHDSIDGVIPAQQAANDIGGITVLSGVEINTYTPDGELHILGYMLDCNDPELKSTLERLRNSRIERAHKMIAKLRKMGIKIDYERVQELAGTGSLGRPHIAQAMLEKGYINSFREAFINYISRGGPAYIERDKMTPAEAVQLILKAKGIPALAHPFTSNNPEPFIKDLKLTGMMALEVYYGSYSSEQVEELLRIAHIYDLIPTGGSDFHGLDVLTEAPLGTVDVPLESAERLIALARERKSENKI